MRALIIVLLSIMLCRYASSQDSLRQHSLVPRNAVKFSPLHLISFYPTIELSYEHVLWKKITLQGELGYVLDLADRDAFQNKRGIKTKLETRYYWVELPYAKMTFYGALERYFNAVNFDRQDSRIECFDIDCSSSFRRFYHYKVEYREHGTSLKLGWMVYFSDFFVDLNSGFAVRSIRYLKPENIGNDFNELSSGMFPIPDERTRVVLSPVMGVRIGYRFN